MEANPHAAQSEQPPQHRPHAGIGVSNASIVARSADTQWRGIHAGHGSPDFIVDRATTA
jgi:hypothetical protein